MLRDLGAYWKESGVLSVEAAHCLEGREEWYGEIHKEIENFQRIN
jgi:hypothetical protein